MITSSGSGFRSPYPVSTLQLASRGQNPNEIALRFPRRICPSLVRAAVNRVGQLFLRRLLGNGCLDAIVPKTGRSFIDVFLTIKLLYMLPSCTGPSLLTPKPPWRGRSRLTRPCQTGDTCRWIPSYLWARCISSNYANALLQAFRLHLTRRSPDAGAIPL